MAYYLVKARPVNGRLRELHERIEAGHVASLRPFGKTLEYSLVNARYSFDGYVLWEEEDYCSPPLAMEREAVLDKYFQELTMERVEKGSGWSMIRH